MKSLNEIIEVKQRVEKELFSLIGVNAVDVGYKYKDGKRTDEITIRVHVDKKQKHLAKDQLIPKDIEGIKTDVIENKIELFVEKLKLQDHAELQLDAGVYNPLRGGISIGPKRVINGYVFVGTLGIPVKDASTGEKLLLSNFHVMCVDTTWSVGDIMVQPSRVDSSTYSDIGKLKRAVLSSHVDGAVSTIEFGKTANCEIVDIGNINGTATAVLNSAVRKRGRTTNLTQGFVDAINATVNVDYGPGIGMRTLTNQIGIRPNTAVNPKFSQGGDSGSVVVDANNKVIGLLYAGNATTGYTFANPINYVLSELNIQLCTRKSILKDVRDGSGGKLLEKKDFKESTKELIKESIKELKESRKEVKEKERKEFKDFKEVKEIREKPSDFNNPTIKYTEGSQEDLSQYVEYLENLVGELSAFITQDQRPDLSQGAFSQENDV